MQKVAAHIDNLIHLFVLFIAFFVPLFFINQTTDFFEFPKLAVLVVLTLVMFGLWVFSWIAKNQITFTKTPLDLPLLILLATVITSTLLSASRYPAIFGVFPRIHGSAISYVTYILLYFITVSNLRTPQRIRNLLYTLLGTSVLIALVTLMSYFKIYLPFSFAKSVNFTPTGSTFSTLALLTILLPLPILSILKPNKFISPAISSVIASVFSLTISLVGNLPLLVINFFSLAFCFLISNPKKTQNISLFSAPVAIFVVMTLLSYLPFSGNPFQTKRAVFPQEIQLPLKVSWKVSASAFRDAPFIGTGPGTYLFAFTAYKPTEFNALNIWSFSFDTAHNEFLLSLSTLGGLGFGLLVLISFIVINIGRRHLLSSQEYLPAISVSVIVTVVLLLIHPTTLVSFVVTFFIFASLFMSIDSLREKIAHLSLGLKAASGDKSFDLFPVILFLLFVIGAVPTAFYTYRTVLADVHHRNALSIANKSGNQTYLYLQKAESLNPYIDLYRIDMAQTNFALANAIATQKGPSASSPAGSLTDTDKQTLQTLLKQAITESQVAVALSPLSARNYEIMASIYRNITGVSQNALAFSLDAYSKAIQRDPLNPMLRLNAGGVYYTAKNYDMAVRFFTDAVNLKSDYANAYYNLAIALRDKGDLTNAKAIAEQTMALMKKNTTDINDVNYKKAAELLADLSAKVPTPSTTKPGLTEPAAETTNALKNPKLPITVPDLGKPPQISTPSAVTR